MNRREKYRVGLHTLYLPVFDALCAELGEEWQPYYGLRSFALQDSLFAIGRSLSGKIVTNARGGESPHNYGCATDWGVWQDGITPTWPIVSDLKWAELKQACERVGARWGGNFKSVDCPHVELALTVSWKSVRAVYLSQGLAGALNYVRDKQEK